MKYYNGDSAYVSVIYQNDEIVGGKCANGKILTLTILNNLESNKAMPSCD